jgi:carbon monoxide dehydrogenase subunit G
MTMQLEHVFTVPVPVDEAFTVLRDVERIAPCMPGATIGEVRGDEFTGTVKVKVGPITVTYRGDARFVDVDPERHTATIEASGKETRGTGTARATVRADLVDRGASTEVTVTTDLAITGKPAQFGRGVMAEVGEKLIGRFADCLAEQLAGAEQEAVPSAATSAGAGQEGPRVTADPAPPPAAPAPAEPAAMATEPAAPRPGDAKTSAVPEPAVTPVPPASRERPRPADDVIDLLDVAGTPVLKRAAPVVAAVAALLLFLRRVRRVRRRRRAAAGRWRRRPFRRVQR